MTTDVKYSIRSKFVNPWIGKPYVSYQLVKHYTEWYDPSYGNGGGDYKDYERVLISNENLETIKRYKEKLEIINDDKPD